jgi:hypothetical protein
VRIINLIYPDFLELFQFKNDPYELKIQINDLKPIERFMWGLISKTVVIITFIFYKTLIFMPMVSFPKN